MSSEIIRNILGLRETSGDAGIEVEMEACSTMPTNIKGWRSEHDGSLRGYSMEYVMTKPRPIDEVDTYLQRLKKVLDESQCQPVFSERAGVHVHVNVQELTVKQVVAMALTYYCLEDVLVRFCGENREGNHFCLRVRDAEFVVQLLHTAVRENNLRYLNNEDIRYASLNFCSLFNYGSLEFRAMETQPDLSKISEWTKMLVSIRDYAIKMDGWDQIPFEISSYGPTGWAKKILGEELFELINTPDFDQKVMASMRPIQTLLYTRFE